MANRIRQHGPTVRGPVASFMESFLPSIVRTVVPFVMAYLLTRGGPVPALLNFLGVEQVTDGVTVAVGVAYHFVVRLLEQYVWPPVGALLGWLKVPVYVPAPEVTDPAVGGGT